MFPLLPADLLRALGPVLIPLAWVTAGWPSAAVMFLVFGAQWLLRWLGGGTLLDWAGQAMLLAAGWFSVVGIYHQVPTLDIVVHAAASAVVAGLVGVSLRAWLRHRAGSTGGMGAGAEPGRTAGIPGRTDAAGVVRAVGPLVAVLALASLTVTLGVVWEIAEWWAHHAVSEEIGVGYDDTLGDLLADSLGALVGSALAVRAADAGAVAVSGATPSRAGQGSR
uniref:hypothetical protein n=1 Tax=uncultured Micrococcus sp. TaxID=114051 RepID=UPI002610C01A|nr:hypothetical protein [uncultured Micrococcus sp.]